MLIEIDFTGFIILIDPGIVKNIKHFETLRYHPYTQKHFDNGIILSLSRIKPSVNAILKWTVTAK